MESHVTMRPGVKKHLRNRSFTQTAAAVLLLLAAVFTAAPAAAQPFQEVDDCTDTYSFEVCWATPAISHFFLNFVDCPEIEVAAVYIDGELYEDWSVGPEGNSCEGNEGVWGLKWDDLDLGDNQCATFTVVFTQTLTAISTSAWVKAGQNCDDISVVGPSCDPCTPPGFQTFGAYCTFTQGFYGNAGGKDCEDRTTEEVINAALGAGGVQVGSSALRHLIAPAGSASDVICRLPGGGPELAISADGPATVSNCPNTGLTGISTWASGPNKGKMRNTLIAQALTLALNLNLDDNLGDLEIEDGMHYFTTIEALDCYDFESDVDHNGVEVNYYFPESVADYLHSSVYSADVNGLMALANDAISGVAPGGSPSLGDITAALGAINDGFDECRVLLGWGVNEEGKNTDRIVQNLMYHYDVSVFPNPFSNETNFMFFVTERMNVSLELFNSQGARILEIYQGEVDANQTYTITMPATDLAGGVYYYRFIAGDAAKIGQIVNIR